MSIEANEILRASRCLRTMPLTSARAVASTKHAACHSRSARLASTTTQLAEMSRPMSYCSQKAAVSARSGSISLTHSPSAPACSMC